MSPRPTPSPTWSSAAAPGEPVAYITGQRAFWTIDLEVGPGALIPRPDSETLIAAAVEHFAGTAGPARILDLGTGPGHVAARRARRMAQGDRARGRRLADRLVLCPAQRRAARPVGPRRASSSATGRRGSTSRFDLILCNPPYVATDAETGPGVAEYEPAEALFAGADGLDDYRRLAPVIGRLLAHGRAGGDRDRP